MRASADRRRVTNVSPVCLNARRFASFSVKRKSSRTRCATIWKAAIAEFEPKMAEILRLGYDEVQVLKQSRYQADFVMVRRVRG